jgi:hypothetical protein
LPEASALVLGDGARRIQAKATSVLVPTLGSLSNAVESKCRSH